MISCQSIRGEPRLTTNQATVALTLSESRCNRRLVVEVKAAVIDVSSRRWLLLLPPLTEIIGKLRLGTIAGASATSSKLSLLASVVVPRWTVVPSFRVTANQAISTFLELLARVKVKVVALVSSPLTW